MWNIYFLLQSLLILQSESYKQDVVHNINITNISGLKTDENRLRYQIAELGISSPENIVEHFCSGNIEETCRKFKMTIQIVHKLYLGYSNLKSDNLYVKLFEGIERLNDFCKDENLMRSIYMLKCLLNLIELCINILTY